MYITTQIPGNLQNEIKKYTYIHKIHKTLLRKWIQLNLWWNRIFSNQQSLSASIEENIMYHKDLVTEVAIDSKNTHFKMFVRMYSAIIVNSWLCKIAS